MKHSMRLALITRCAETAVQAAPKGQTLEQFRATAKKNALTKAWDYSEAVTTETFNKIDTNQDGIATASEKTAYWAAWEKTSILE